MPGATPVQMALLPKLDDGGFRAFVRFPKGWSRPDAGHYAVADEFVVLDGELSLNGETWQRGGHAWVPAFQRRRDLGIRRRCRLGSARRIARLAATRPQDRDHEPCAGHRAVFTNFCRRETRLG